jgi:hypothetical protein
VNLSAPLKGLTASKALTEMSPRDALRLDNWVCRSDGLHVRAGFAVQSVIQSNQDKRPLALMKWYGSATDTMFATTASGLYDVTSGTASLILPLQSGWASSAIQSNDSGATLLFVNGRDGLFGYRGGNWAQMTVTGCDAGKWHAICVHQQRVCAIDTDNKCWYLDHRAISGPAHQVAMPQHLRSGGSLVGIASIKPTGGRGASDMLTIATSGGELVVYAGDNPSRSESFNLHGVFDVPLPVTRNCFANHGSSVSLITRDGILPVPDILGLDKAKKIVAATTGPIKNLWDLSWSDNSSSVEKMGEYIAINSGSARFDLISVPGAGTYVNAPETDGWSRFSDLDATCWLDDGQHLHFGRSDGTICRYGGSSDNGTTIKALMVGAFQKLNPRGRTVQFNRARLNFVRNPGYKPLFKVLLNYQGVPSGVVGSSLNQSAYTWPLIDWPLMPEPPAFATAATDRDRGLSGRGHCAAPILAVKALSPLIYTGAELQFT